MNGSLDLEDWIVEARQRAGRLRSAIRGMKKGAPAFARLTEELTLYEDILQTYEQVKLSDFRGTELMPLLDAMNQGIQHCAQCALDAESDESLSICPSALEVIDTRLHRLARQRHG